jgi:RNA-directed DNA polymerase
VKFPRATRLVMGFKSKQDAERVLELLRARMAEYGLTLHPDKTRLVAVAQPARSTSDGKGPGTFDFLGFTVYWARARSGTWTLRMKTRKARLQRALKALGEFCRRRRHDPLKEQHAALKKRLQGHYNYFAVNGNHRSLRYLAHQAERVWHKWLGRRSQRKRYTWQRFRDFLQVFPLPKPTIRVRIWVT